MYNKSYYGQAGMSPMEITMKRTDNGITLYADAKKVGEINFTLQEDGLYDIYHTEVDSSMNGKGLAGKLVAAAADVIAQEQKRTRATCTYAAAWLKRHHEYDALYVPEDT